MINQHLHFGKSVGKQLSRVILLDGSLNEIADKYGGWPRLLDPTRATPVEFVDELEEAGYSGYSFESIKNQIGKPERQYWIALIASIIKSMQGTDTQDWHGEMLDEFLPKMKEHAITDDEIKIAIAGP